MKILLVSNLVLDRTSNMGKTFLAYFKDFMPGEIAQFYIYSEVPTDDSVCRSYYRFTDWDALRSVLDRRICGTVFGADEIDKNRTDPRTDTGMQTAVYRAGSRKTPLLHMMRNYIWEHSNWNSRKLRDWIADFGPDAVFFASGDSLFMYDIARSISESFQIPLIVSAVDDFYVFNRNEGLPFGKMYFRAFMNKVHETMDHAACLLPICDSMDREYRDMFRIPSHVLRTPVEERDLHLRPDAEQISYIGNLDFNRYRQLIDIGRTLKKIASPDTPCRLDVYSQERNPEILNVMTEENGIRFHGAISSEEVDRVMAESRMVVHTESFDPVTAEIVRYSVSTKIPESLMNGPCLLAYGPEGIESIEYLKRNGAAFVITSPGDLEQGMRTVLSDGALRSGILVHARELAHKNHDAAVIGKTVRGWIEECVECRRS